MIPKQQLFDVINKIAPSDEVTGEQIADIINELVMLDILSTYGSVELYEDYINRSYGDLLTNVAKVSQRKEND